MNCRVIVVGGALLALASCATEPTPGPNAMAIDVTFGLANLCGLGVSPKITVINPPAGTAKYAIRMRNIDVLLPSPWEATVNASGAVIPEGAAPDYRGPCPGQFQQHRYRFTVTALDAGGQALAQAQFVQLALAASAFVQRNQEGIAQPPMSPIDAMYRQQQNFSGGPSRGPTPVLQIAPTLGILPPPNFYREPNDPAFGPPVVPLRSSPGPWSVPAPF